MLSGGGFALMSARAVGVLRPLFEGCGEFLPLLLLGRSYWWFNCHVVFDGLDEIAAAIEWAGAERFFGGKPGWPFDAELVGTAPAVFRVPQSPVGDLFVGEIVAAAVVDAGLTGFDLCPVWPGERAGGPFALQGNLTVEERDRLIWAERQTAHA